MNKVRRSNRLSALVLVSVAAGMVGLAFASVPFYRWFCQATGFGGTPRIATAASLPAKPGAGAVSVRFDANVALGLDWRFSPAQAEMRVRLGELVLAHYVARNLSSSPVTATATFNVTPDKAGRYFNKIQCFCFTEQRLAPGEEAKLSVSFYVDPDILAHSETSDVRTITLSYTFFPLPPRPTDVEPQALSRTSAASGTR